MIGGKMSNEDTRTAEAAKPRPIYLVPEAIEASYDLDAALAPYHVERRQSGERTPALHLVRHPDPGE